jgi:hypothetical protein
MRLKRLGSSAVVILCALADHSARGQEQDSCCEAEVNVGFSGEIVRGGALFEGIAGAGDLCTADQGEILSPAPAGTRREKTVCVNIISNIAGQGEGIMGWSYGVALDGAAELVSITFAGTAADSIPNGGYRDPEGTFNKTQIIDPAKNGGQRGFVSAIANTNQMLIATLPRVGTESIYAAVFVPQASQGAEDQVATLRFQNGLIGTGQPVDNVITVSGNIAPVCNFALARVNLVFRQSGPGEFRRGDANGDARVDIADPIWILNELFAGGPASPCADATDANDDGVESVGDAVLLVEYIFRGSGVPPPAPGPETCGPDPTADPLDCALTGPACP